MKGKWKAFPQKIGRSFKEEIDMQMLYEVAGMIFAISSSVYDSMAVLLS